MKRCTHCILPECFMHLEFDTDGVCSICRKAEADNANANTPRRVDDGAGRRELAALLTRERAKGGRYDCLLSFSGGKDSIYALYVLHRQFQANPLLVNYDNGYLSETCYRRLRTCADAFGVDLVTYRPGATEQTILLKTFFERIGELSFTCDIEVYSLIVRTAQQHGIGLAVTGGGGASEGITQLSRHRGVDVFNYARTYLEGVPGVDLSRLAVSPADFEAIRLFQMGDHFTWDHDEILRVIRDELGIEYPGADGEAYMHNECRLCRLQDHVRFLKRGYGRNEPVLAALVRHGVMTREEALRRAELEATAAKQPPEVLPEFCARLGYSADDLYAIVNDPAVVYRPPWYHRKS